VLSYNLFLLFKFDSLCISEYRQQNKTFRLKYFFLAGKIIRTARSVIMKFSEKYPYKAIYEKGLSQKYHTSCLNLLFLFKPTRKKSFQMPEFVKVDHQK